MKVNCCFEKMDYICCLITIRLRIYCFPLQLVTISMLTLDKMAEPLDTKYGQSFYQKEKQMKAFK